MIAHIGYHKTGTTFLQNNIYPYINGVEFLDYFKCDTIFKGLINHDDTSYDETATHRLIYQHKTTDKTGLFSFEGLVGPLFHKTSINNRAIADRLKKLGFEKIIISIRSQERLLESAYLQYIQEGGTIHPETFYDPAKGIFDWEYANYYSLIDYYYLIFGKDNVLVLLQEQLRNEENATIERLLSFLGDEYTLQKNSKLRRSNTSLSRLSLQILRFFNRFTYNKYKPTQKISKRITTWKIRFLLEKYFDPYLFSHLSTKKSFMPEDVRTAIFEFYKDGNEKLQFLTGINLKKYHYPL